MKNTILILILLAPGVLALQDAAVTVDSHAVGLCISADTPDAPVCANGTMLLDGTRDHIVYIIPETNIVSNSTMRDKLLYMFQSPLTLITGGVGMFIVFVIFVLAIYELLVRQAGGRMR
jgi:hypothetical protein